MKGMLIIDMPKSCDCCRFCTVNFEHSVICDLTKKYLGMADVIPDECPLRPMPDKAADMLLDGIAKMEEMKKVTVSYIDLKRLV